MIKGAQLVQSELSWLLNRGASRSSVIVELSIVRLKILWVRAGLLPKVQSTESAYERVNSETRPK
jgi:hypothetical protein